MCQSSNILFSKIETILTLILKTKKLSILYNNQKECFDLSSVDNIYYTSNHISGDERYEIIIEWKNRTILSNRSVKLEYNHNSKKLLYQTSAITDISIEYDYQDYIHVNFTVYPFNIVYLRNQFEVKIDSKDHEYIDPSINIYDSTRVRYEDMKINISDLKGGKHTLNLKMLAYQLSSVEASQEFTIPFLSMNLEIISFDISPKVFPAFGNAEITITGKVKYFHRRRNTIKYSINNERYQTLTSFNSFSTTPSTSIDVTNLIIPIPAPEIPFNETINFSIPNRFNSREFSVSLISIVEESYSVPKSLTFKDIFKVIFLDMSIQDNQEFINNDGKSFHIEGMIYNFGSSKPINLMYKFDDKDSKILKTYENIGNEGDHVQLDIPLSSDLPESNNHTISIWAEKGFNRKSNEYILNFSFIYNRPNIEGTTISMSPYTKNINDNIAFEGTVSDNDGNGIVSVYCRFDNETENKMMSKQIINAQNEKYALNFTVKIPPSLTEDFHIIYIWAVDSNQKESDYLHFQFYFKHNEPSISITTDNNMQIRKGINNKLEIKGNVIDLDGSGSILIYYIIDNSTEQYLETITIYNTSYHEFNKKIDLPANLNEEIHEIRIYCKDGNLKKSNEEIINFMYLFNNPSIIVNKEPLSIYHNKIDTNISVSGTFTNDNYADNIYFLSLIHI